ncbi:hypothetical protein [Enterocloster sp.]|uniref:hypothetical protein n=1 Tax=Enterocloster sp. TaxID=2719315 RepID=UPI0039A3B258
MAIDKNEVNHRDGQDETSYEGNYLDVSEQTGTDCIRTWSVKELAQDIAAEFPDKLPDF